MRLCIVTHKIVRGDGQGRVNYEIAKKAVELGHHLTLIASEVDRELSAMTNVTWICIQVKNFPSELLRNQIFALRSFIWLLRHRNEFDILHVNGFITWLSADINSVHFVHSSWLTSPVHSSKVIKGLAGWYQWVYTKINAVLERPTFRKKSGVIIAVSELVRDELLNIGVDKNKIYVITNGVDTEEFSQGESERVRLGLPLNVPIAVFAGDIKSPRKNLDTVLHSLVQLPSLHLVVLGNTNGSIYPDMAKNLGISNRVMFLGYRNDMPSIMRSCDMFVFPSRYETCGLVILEALSSGLPVITARTAGGAEMVNTDSGFVLENPDDIEGLISCVNIILGDSMIHEKMSLEARRIAEKNQWSCMAMKYMNLYEQIMHEKRQ